MIFCLNMVYQKPYQITHISSSGKIDTTHKHREKETLKGNANRQLATKRKIAATKIKKKKLQKKPTLQLKAKQTESAQNRIKTR